MRKWYNGIDDKTRNTIIYSECSLNELGFELEYVENVKVKEVVYCTDGESYYIITDKGKFFYDSERRMLLKENK